MIRYIGIIFSLALLLSLGSCSSDNKDSAGNPGYNQSGKQSEVTFAVYDVFGKARNYEEFKGKGPLVVNFWGTWCPPCRRELPDLKKIYAEYRPQGLEMIGMAVNDSPGKVRQFAAENGMDWVMLMANDDAIQSFQLGAGIPVTIFIDRQGKEVSRLIGARGYEDFKKEIAKII